MTPTPSCAVAERLAKEAFPDGGYVEPDWSGCIAVRMCFDCARPTPLFIFQSGDGDVTMRLTGKLAPSAALPDGRLRIEMEPHPPHVSAFRGGRQ